MSTEEIDRLFGRLNHKNKTMRAKAGATIAEIGGEENIARLVQLLSLEDTGHRRAAVQALGMVGVDAIPPILKEMRETDNRTVRASCSKALAAVALYFPEEREAFPAAAVDALEQVLEDVDVDPVTKLATVGCLGTVGSDVKHRNGDIVPGNDRAVEILFKLLHGCTDTATGAVAVGAIAQIGQNGSDKRKALVLEKLRALVERPEDSPESGFGYIKEMASSHIEQLQSGPKVPDEQEDAMA